MHLSFDSFRFFWRDFKPILLVSLHLLMHSLRYWAIRLISAGNLEISYPYQPLEKRTKWHCYREKLGDSTAADLLEDIHQKKYFFSKNVFIVSIYISQAVQL